MGFYKKGSGGPASAKASAPAPGLTWSEAVDEALCFGWIDGIRKKIDEARYANRFTPRRTTNWSAVNIKRARALIAAGRMQPAGLKAFQARDRNKSGYSIAQRAAVAFSPAAEKAFRANRAAWTFFEGLPPAYRRNHIWFVESAKKPDTRERRLDNLIRACANGIRLDPMRPFKDQVPDAD